MPTASPPSMLLIRSPSGAAAPHPPDSLTGLGPLFSAIDPIPWNGPAVEENDSAAVRRRLDRLETAARDHGADCCIWQRPMRPAALQAIMTAVAARPDRLKHSLACRIDETIDRCSPVPATLESIVQVVWLATDHLPGPGFFKAVSRAGAWNHLILDGPADTAANRDTVARQPNIVHSWQTSAGNGYDAADDGYRALPPLPGRPLWQMLDDPVHRLVLVNRFGKNWLLRARADDENDRIVTLGESLDYHFCTPDSLPQGYLDEICAMVAAGGTVATTHVRSNLQRAHRIGYVREHGVIVGNSSLKHPRPQYIDRVRRQSGLDLTGFVERGYTSVRPEYRGLGIGTRLLEGLTARAGDRKIFSVIAEDNEATKIIARRNRTVKIATYFSEQAGKPVGIWMPEWMIDADERP